MKVDGESSVALGPSRQGGEWDGEQMWLGWGQRSSVTGSTGGQWGEEVGVWGWFGVPVSLLCRRWHLGNRRRWSL